MYTILLVEDETMELLVLKYAVETVYPHAFHILQAQDGDTAFQICMKSKPELMVVDINIPGMNGLELIKSVLESGINCKILITTAYDKSEYIRKALEMGVIGYLLKPIDISELQTALDRCMEKLQINLRQDQMIQTLEQNIETVCSYAKEYLIQDILSGQAPGEALTSIYGWPENGSLQICLLGWFAKEADETQKVCEVWEKYTQKYFATLSASFEDHILLVMQSQDQRDLPELIFLLNACIRQTMKTLGYGYVWTTDFCSTYEELYGAWNEAKVRQNNQPETSHFPGLPMAALGTRHKRVLLRQKYLSRMLEGQFSFMTNMLKKILSTQETYWMNVLVFLEAVEKYDSRIDVLELAGFFLEDNASERVGKWFEQYSSQYDKNSRGEGGARTRMDAALDIISQRYMNDLTLTDVAEELGLTAPYFSSLFKQYTGKNFILFLNEVRILHAIQLIKDGNTDMEAIAIQCGYVSKKYFFEAFKRVTGQTITQYREEAK